MTEPAYGNDAQSLSEAMRLAIEALRPHYTRHAIADRLNLGTPDDWKTGEKPRAKALRDFLNQKRASKRLSPRWLDFAFEIQELLRLIATKDATARARLREFSSVLEDYLLRFHMIDARHFMIRPTLGSKDYKFRVPKFQSELKCFGSFSDAEPDISSANPGLEGDQRLEFYEGWFDLRPDAFLILDRINHGTGMWEPIAVSIILPLSAEGDREIRAGGVKTVMRLPNGSFGSELSRLLVRDGVPPGALLLDTWIVKRTSRRRGTIGHEPAFSDPAEKAIAARESHQRWASGLLTKHISILTQCSGPVPIHVEPDYWHIRYLCRIWNFSRRHDGQLWTAPSIKGGSVASDLLWSAVSEAAEW